MKTTVPYSRDTNKYYVFEHAFTPGMQYRVSVYVLKTECPQPPVQGTLIDVEITPVGPVEPEEPIEDRQFDVINKATGEDIPW